MEFLEGAQIEELLSREEEKKNIDCLSTSSLNKYFPYILPTSKIKVVPGSFLDIKNFIELNFILSKSDSFYKESFLQKEAYFNQNGDHYLFLDENKNTVGYFVGNVLDWSTYYFRSSLMTPYYRGRKIYQEFTRYLIDKLVLEKFNRVEVHVSPANHTNIHIHNKMQFKLTGMTNTERWGSLLIFVKYLNEHNKTVFEKQYCAEDFIYIQKERSLI